MACRALGKANASTMPGKEDKEVTGQKEVEVRSIEDVLAIGRVVEATRTAQAHVLNDRSSSLKKCLKSLNVFRKLLIAWGVPL